MLENPRSARVRAVAKLAKRHARDQTGLFLLEGPQAVREALAWRPDAIVELYLTDAAAERHPELAAAAHAAGIAPAAASETVVAAMADTVTPQGVVAVARQIAGDPGEALGPATRLVAICEQVRDPGNLGTIIRAADAAGADAVILTGRTVDPFNPKVVRATTGSLFHVPVVRVSEVVDAVAMAHAAGLIVLAADVHGDELTDAREALARPAAWLFGNEAHGLDEATRALADRVLRLPIYGRAESLNLATAASVCLYESAFALRAG